MVYRLETIWVKPYVKSYFENRELDDDLKKTLFRMLANPDTRTNKAINPRPKGYVDWRPIIPQHWFAKNMFALTPVDEREFANLLEDRIQQNFEVAFVNEVASCRRNQVKFEIEKLLESVRDNVMNLDEDSMPMETIRKYMQRYSKRKNIFYSDVKNIKKASLKVSRKSVKSSLRSLRNDGIKLKDWLDIAGIRKNTFYKYFRNEIPTYKENGKLYVVPFNTAAMAPP